MRKYGILKVYEYNPPRLLAKVEKKYYINIQDFEGVEICFITSSDILFTKTNDEDDWVFYDETPENLNCDVYYNKNFTLDIYPSLVKGNEFEWVQEIAEVI